MPKINVKIPKGTKCNGGKVCDQDLDLDLDIPETSPVIQPIPQPTLEIPGQQQITQTIPQPPPVQVPPTNPPEPKERTYTNEELAGLMPPGVNFAVCKGKNCADSKIQNKNMTTKFKECPKCGCNNVAWTSSICPCCGASEPVDEELKEDYWSDSNIEIENEGDE